MPSKMTSHVVLNLSEITIDYGWNSRSEARAKFVGAHTDGVETGADADTEAPGIEGLARSMELSGQDTEVDVVIPADGKYKGKKLLVAGFRRATAVAWLAQQKVPSAPLGAKPGQIAVKLQEGLTEIECRQVNLRENVRDQLSASDVAYGIGELVKLSPKISQKEISEIMGKSVPYVSKLYAIVEGLKPELFVKWRTGAAKPLPVNTIHEISQMDKAKQTAAYDKAIADRDTPAAEADPNGWVETAKDNAFKLGKNVGTLARLGIVHGYNAETVVVDGEEVDTTSMTGLMVTEVVKCKSTLVQIGADKKPVLGEDGKPVKKPVTTPTLNSIAKSFHKGYEEGLVGEDADEEEDETAEEAAAPAN